MWLELIVRSHQGLKIEASLLARGNCPLQGVQKIGHGKRRRKRVIGYSIVKHMQHYFACIGVFEGLFLFFFFIVNS